MMSIRRPLPANDTGLLGYMPDVLPVTNSTGFREPEETLVDLLRRVGFCAQTFFDGSFRASLRREFSRIPSLIGRRKRPPPAWHRLGIIGSLRVIVAVPTARRHPPS